jgi:dTDP-4-dehydrorhamnose reductase
VKLIIIGSTGTLGRAMLATFPHALAPSRAVWRQTLHIKGEAGDVVINCAGNVSQDLSFEALRDDNADLPKSIYSTCTSKGMKLIHFSDAAIFDGQPHFASMHNEASSTASLLCATGYAKSKLLGEEQLWPGYRGNNDLLVIRASFVGPNEPEDPFTGQLNYYNNWLTTIELSKTVQKILKSAELSQEAFRKGLVHLFSPHIVSELELMRMLNEALAGGPFKMRAVLAPLELRRQLSTIHEQFYLSLAIPNLIDQINDPAFANLLSAQPPPRNDSLAAGLV